MENQIAVDFAHDGAVKLSGVFTDWVDILRAGLERNMASPSPRERTYQPQDGSAHFFQDYCVWASVPEYRDFIFNSPLATLAAEITQSKTIQMFHDHILVKEPGSTFPTPWHQDQPYYFVEAKQTISFWIPLDAVARENGVEYVQASHKGEALFCPQRFSGEALIADDPRPPVPDINANRANYTLLGWDVEPGDAIAFDFRTLHGAGGNNATSRRRAISFRLLGEDARICANPAEASPAFPELDLPIGALLEGEAFPILYPRSK